LWMGRPCLCHSEGVMNELAAGGGCLTVDMADPAAIEASLERLADDLELRTRLTEQALHTRLLDWATYGAEIDRRLRAVQDKFYQGPSSEEEELMHGTDDVFGDWECKFRNETRELSRRLEHFVTLTNKSVAMAEAAGKC
jgi:hypothetical protein